MGMVVVWSNWVWSNFISYVKVFLFFYSYLFVFDVKQIMLCGDLILLCGDLITLCGNLISLCGDLISLCGDLISLCGNLIRLCGNFF